VDVLANFENLARTPVRRIEGPCGQVRIAPVEELIVERALISMGRISVSCRVKGGVREEQ
jgi:hypothetical protein